MLYIKCQAMQSHKVFISTRKGKSNIIKIKQEELNRKLIGIPHKAIPNTLGIYFIYFIFLLPNVLMVKSIHYIYSKHWKMSY